MVEKLINKLIEEAREKSKKIIDEGKKEFERRLNIEKEKINSEFEERLKKEKEKIDFEIESEIINYKIEFEKEILAQKNLLLDEIIKRVEENFNLFLDENFEKILKKVMESATEKDIKIYIPEGKNVNIEYEVIKDKNLKNSFKIKSKNWEIDFSWESLKNIFEGRIRELANKLLQF